MRDRVRLRNQAIKESGSERARGKKDEWALNESIMINQDASHSLPLSPSLFSLRLIIIIILIIHTQDTQNRVFQCSPLCIPIRTVYTHSVHAVMKFSGTQSVVPKHFKL